MERSPINKRRSGSRSNLERECDRLFQQVVAKLWGDKCAVCEDAGSAAHHIIPRRFKRYRWAASNGIYLCSKCHDKAHDYPHWIPDWLVREVPWLFEVYNNRDVREGGRMAEHEVVAIRDGLKARLARTMPGLMQFVKKLAPQLRRMQDKGGWVDLAWLVGPVTVVAFTILFLACCAAELSDTFF